MREVKEGGREGEEREGGEGGREGGRRKGGREGGRRKREWGKEERGKGKGSNRILPNFISL